jgi:hypothetical protein
MGILCAGAQSEKAAYQPQHLRDQAFRVIMASALQVCESCARNAPSDVFTVPARKYWIIAPL